MTDSVEYHLTITPSSETQAGHPFWRVMCRGVWLGNVYCREGLIQYDELNGLIDTAEEATALAEALLSAAAYSATARPRHTTGTPGGHFPPSPQSEGSL